MSHEEGHFSPLLGIFGAKGLFIDTFRFEGRGCIPLPPLDAPLVSFDDCLVAALLEIALKRTAAISRQLDPESADRILNDMYVMI